MAATIFLSYASKDQKTAETICQALEGRGFQCWMAARNVHPGENFQEAIVRAIRAAKVMLFVFSANSNNSDEVKKEIALAGKEKVFVIPIRVEDVIPNEALAYEFATRQWIDLFKDWEFSLEQLSLQIEAVSALVTGGNVTEPPSPGERLARRLGVTEPAGDRTTEAIAPVEHAAPIGPDVEAIYAAGNAHAKAGEYDQAIEQYDHVIRLDPDHINALNNRGNAYLAKGAHDEAVADFDKAITLKPDFATAYCNRGNAFQGRGEYDRAIRDYGVALQLKPDLAVALDNRAKAYDRKGMHDQARKDHAAAVAMRNPNVPTPPTAPTSTTGAGPTGALKGALTGGNRVFMIAGGALVGLLLLGLIAGAVFKSRTGESSAPASSVVAESSASSAAPASNVMSAADADKNGDAAWNAKNYDDALTFYRQSASQGDAAGQNGLGTLYYFGRGGLPQDYSQAMKWFQLSAAQGNPEAQNSVGNIYENGYGVPVDYSQAMKWYLLSANQGNSSGQANVGALYANGQGVTTDYAEAMRWFQLSAAQGDATGQSWIGYLYANGDGVSQDMEQARFWYRKSAANGSEDAKTWLAQHPE
jgi:hypothetical protein